MVTREDLENFLLRLELPYRELDEGLWLVSDGNGDEVVAGPIVVNHTPPLLLLRVEVMNAPDNEELAKGLFRDLLELNATDLVHGAYGLDGNEIVLTDTLQLQDLDFSEFQASVESIMLALTSHFEPLSRYRNL